MESYTQRNRLNLKLKPIFIGKLAIITQLTEPAFKYQNGFFEVVLVSNKKITKNFISNYATKFEKNIYISEVDFETINNKLKEQLTMASRSLSIGDVEKNATKQLNLLTMQMASLYNDPFNDELLINQFQNTKAISVLLTHNKDIHKSLFKHLFNQKYHYTHKQPLLSSILFLGYLQSLNTFSDIEIQNLFITSYFKDIGMSLIPREKFELANLSEFDKKLFSDHAENSMKILEGRITLNQSQLNMIKNHHYMNYKIQALIGQEKPNHNEELLSGIESAMMSSLDIFVAMISERPYREATTHFTALELLKRVLSDEYPQEFKQLVIYIKKFLRK